MILRDANDNIRMFGASVEAHQVRAKVAWINKSARRKLEVYSMSNPNIRYNIDIGKKFSRQATPALLEHLYVSRIK